MDKVNEIVNLLGEDKASFLSEVRSAIGSYVDSRSVTECLTLVSRNSDGSRGFNWYPKEVLDGYTPRFMAFLRGQKYNGKVIDSALTDPIVELVSDKFEQFYTEKAVVISKPLLESILSNHTLVTQLANQIIEVSNKSVPTYLRAQLSKALIHYLEEHIHADVVHLSGQAVQNIVAATTSTAVAIPVSATLLKYMAFSLKGVIAKLLATAATKTMLMGLLKKIVAVKIIAALVSLVGVTIGGGSIALIVAPLLAGFIAYEAYTLPSQLAEKVSIAVANELEGQFDEINRNVAVNILQGFGASAISAFASDVARDEAIKELLRKIA